MRFVSLTRVSTEGQADEGYGLDVQAADIAAWAKAGKHRIVHRCVEEGISGGAPLSARTGIITAMQWLRDERADGIVIPRLDRLARDLILQEQLYAELVAIGAVLRSTVPAEDAALVHDPTDPTRALVRRVLGAIADYERDLIRMRLRAGIIRKAECGGYVGGRPPYGWIAHGRELVPVETEQAVRRQIKTWHRAGWSYKKIADELNGRAIPAKKGGLWSSGVVGNVVRNDTRAVNIPSIATANHAKGKEVVRASQ